MTGFAKRWPEFDELIFSLVGDTMLIGSVEVPGVFNRKPRQVELQDGAILAVDLSFDCNVKNNPVVLELEDGDEIEIVDDETYLFSRRIPDEADETGLVIIELRRNPAQS